MSACSPPRANALVREFDVRVPGDLIVRATPARTRATRRHFHEVMDIEIDAAAGIVAKKKR